jgi:hypothetical protein
MLFGDRASFAVEIYHEPSEPRWVGFGRMCLHIKGHPVGRLDERHCSLFNAVERIYEFAQRPQPTWDNRLKGHSDEEIFAWLDAALYEGAVADGPDEVGQFEFLTNAGEQFDEWKTFIYSTPEREVHILCRRGEEMPFFGTCSEEAFRAVATQLMAWFNANAKKTQH